MVDADMSPWYVNKRGCEMMKDMPTIEAIPIDWIEEHCDEVADMVVAMWRKENESNTCD